MPTYVTSPYLPNKKKLISKINQIYNSKQLTNYGPNVQKLEKLLQKRFKIKHAIAVANGTLGIQVALQALNLRGEVITSPFSYVATTSSIVWQNLKPVFADIDPDSFNISPDQIKLKITPNTQALLPVHVFGNANKIEQINKIGKQFKLRIIYDASHCFDINYRDKSILSHGDCSVISFHATKIFHTIEGGAIFTNNTKLANKIRSLINFGYENKKIKNIGINCKMNEFEAILGLLALDDMEKIKRNRKKNHYIYLNSLKSGVYNYQIRNKFCNNNYSYFPIVFKNEQKLMKAVTSLGKLKIYPRRYFYPSLNTLNIYGSYKKCSNAERLSKRILCLPQYDSLNKKDILKISEILNQN